MAVWYGRLCRRDGPGRCLSCPTELEPAEFACPSCEGSGCRRCDDAGTFTLTSCAHAYVTPDVWRMLQAVDDYRAHGMLPEDGNGLSQSASFVASLRLMGRDMDRWDALLTK